jgi:predicted RNA-binding protein
VIDYISKEDGTMCLSNVYRNNVDDSNLLAKNVADIKFVDGKIVFTDIMGIRTTFDGTLEQIDLTVNFIIVK